MVVHGRLRLAIITLGVSIALAVVGGCASLLLPGRPDQRVPAGSRLHIDEAIDIPRDEWIIDFQDGRPAPEGASTADPYCELKVDSEGYRERRQLAPGTWTVTDYWLDSTLLGPHYAGSGRSYGDIDLYEYGTVVRLEGGGEPAATQLYCARRADGRRARYLDVAAMRRILGETVRLELAR